MGASLAASKGRTARSNSSTRSNDGFVSVSSPRSSSSNNHIEGLPMSSQAAAAPEGQLVTSPPGLASTSPSSEAQNQALPGGEPHAGDSDEVNISDSNHSPQPDACDPFQQSLNALHSNQQEPIQPVPSCHESGATSDSQGEVTHSAQETEQQTSLSDSKPQPSDVSQAPAQSPFQNPTADTEGGRAAASSRGAGVATGSEGVSDAVSPSPVGSASTDAWEMVQDANNIYNWKAGSLLGRSLSSNVRQGSQCSEEGESYSQCKLFLCTCLPVFSIHKTLLNCCACTVLSGCLCTASVGPLYALLCLLFTPCGVQ